MTTYYPNHHQPTPSFLKKYARNAYNRAQHDAQQYDEAAISLQVRTFATNFPWSGEKLFNPGRKKNSVRDFRACKNKHFSSIQRTFAKNNRGNRRSD